MNAPPSDHDDLMDFSISPEDSLAWLHKLFEAVSEVPVEERMFWVHAHVHDEEEREALLHLLDAEHDSECTLASHLQIAAHLRLESDAA